jgi:hypothetical protein
LGEHGEQRLYDGQAIGGHIGQHRFVERFARRVGGRGS